MTQDALAADLERRNARIIERVAAIPAHFPPEAMRRRPAPGKWSPAEILEHLVKSDEGYLARMRPLIRRARAEGRERGWRDRRWRPTLMGRLLVWALGSKRRTPTLAALEPREGGARAEASLARFLELRREIGALIGESAALPWRRLRFTSPYSALVRPNLGDAFRVTVVHAERHLDQIDRQAPGRR